MTNRSTARGAKTVWRSFRPRNISRASLLFGTALGCSIAIMAAAPEKAWAANECGAIVAGTVTCDADGVPATDVNPYPTGIVYTGNAGQDLTVVVTGAVDIVSPGFSGVLAYSSVNQDVTINVGTGASVDAGYVGFGAVASGTGDATIVVASGVDITAGTAGIYGVAAAGTVDITSDSSITVDGDTAALVPVAAGIYAVSSTGGVFVDIAGDITVDTTTDYYAFGIVASGNTVSSVDSTGDITVNNYYISGNAYGITASSVGNSVVYQTGNVDVYAGLNAYGVIANSTGQSAYVEVTGNVSTYAYLGNSVAVAGLSAVENVEIDVVGDVDVYAFGDGFGVLSNSGLDGDVNVTGNVTVGTGSGSATGIEVYAGGNAVVNVTGDITATSGIDTDYNGDEAYGLDVTTVGTADVTVTGNVTASSNYSFASAVDVYAGDDMTITVDGTITANAYAAAWGVFAYSTGGADITIDVGDIVVNSGSDLGLGAGTPGGAGIQAYTGGITGVIDITAGSITTTGDNTEGVQAVSAGTIDITVDSVSTTGLASEGVFAYSLYGTAVDVGTVTTTGDASTGVYAYSFLGSSSVIADDISTTGTGAGGIYAYGYLGATVDSGVVSTTGDFSNGIEARSAFNAVDVTSDDVDTTGYGSVGILAFGYGGTTVTSGTVSTSGDYAEGIVALDILGPVSVTTTGLTETSGYAATGIRAGSYGDVTVDVASVTTSGAGAYGINAYSLTPTYNGALVDVTFDSVVTSGDPTALPPVVVVGPPDYTLFYYGASSHGIVADGGLGNVSVVGGDVTTSGNGANGIIASGFGDVYINVDDVVTTGDALVNFTYDGPGTPYTDYYRGAVGINASVLGGDLAVYADSVTTSGYEATGIVASGSAYYDSVATTYTGTVTVGVNTVTTTGDFADGIVASNAGGDVFVTANNVSTTGEGSDGIIVAAQAYYDSLTASVLVGSANVTAGTVTTTGDDAYGIYALGQGGDVNITAFNVTTSGDGAIGIFAQTQNYYDSGQLVNLQGDIEIDAGAVTTSGLFSHGIYAYAEGGNVDVSAANVLTTGDGSFGIIAIGGYYGPDPVLGTFYSGDVIVSASNVETQGAGSIGIYAVAAGGDVTINAQNVEVFGAGSSAIIAITGGLDVNNSDNILINTSGNIYAYDGYGIIAVSADSTNINVGVNSDVYGYYTGIFANSVVGTAIENDGTISGGSGTGIAGRSIDIDGGAASIFNDNTGVIYGSIDLTDNNDVLDNEGTFEAYGTSEFGLGADLLDNDGVVGIRRDFATAGNVTFNGLETFRNDGDVNFVNGHVNDTLTLPNTTFVGVAGSSTLTVDAQLGGPGSAADRLLLTGTGNATGVTEIRVNDLVAGPGSFNFGGILVVDSASNEVGTEFTMDNIDKGFVEYSLIFDAAADQWLIVGLPDDEVGELVAFTAFSQDFWRRSADSWGARTQEIRDAQAWGGGSPRREGWEMWMQANIGDEDFDNFETYSFGGFTFNSDLSTHSDWRGFQFGFDNLSGGPDNYSFWGLTMGFTEQETRFEFDDNSVEHEGWNVGVYGGWNWGGLYLNGLLKGDFYEVDANFTSIPEMIELDGTTWGAKGEIGYRWDGGGWFFEPHAELAWSTTDLDGFDQAGLQADWDDADSLLGKAGARIGTTFGSGAVVLSPYIGLYAVEEFEGDNDITVATGGLPLTFTDAARDGYGQVDFGFTTQTFYGLEGFMKGEIKFGDEADGWTARMGARWRW